MSNETFKKYVDLHRQKLKLQEKLDDLKAEIREQEENLVEFFAETGLQKVSTDDGPTLWLDRKIWASAGGDVDGAVAALEQAGEHALVKKTINRNTLSAWVREKAEPLDSPEDVQAKLPKGLGSAIRVTETTNVRVRGL